MKKQILSLIIILNLFALSAKTISREYTTFKPNNIKNLKKAVDTFTLDGNSKVKSTLYYNQNKRLSQSYFEYDNNQITYVKSDYKTHPDGLKTLENYYSYPDYTYENDNPYLQIAIYENNPHGLLKQINTENPDGTYFHEYYLDITKRSTLFTKYVSKYSKERKELYSEQYYEKQLYKGKVYRIIEYRDENANVISTLYYDKDGNEIPKSELGISE